MTHQSGKIGSRLFRSTRIFAVMTFISRLLGLVRDVLVAHIFGATAGADAFYVAFKIPNFMRRLSAEGAFSQAFVPLLSEYKKTRSLQEVRQLVAEVTGVLGVSLLGLTILAVVFSPWVIQVFAPGFAVGSARFELATVMLRIIFPYLLFISLVACSAAVLNTYHIFGPPAFVPVLLNLCLIVACYYAKAWFSEGIFALAWAVFIAGFIQWLFLLPNVYRLNLLTWPRVGFSSPMVRRMLRLMLPALFGASVAQVNLLLDTIFASFLPVGSVSWLYYASRLMNFPLGIFGVGLATVVLPSLSGEYAAKNEQTYSEILEWGLRAVLLVGLPATLGLFFLAEPIINAFFHYGVFSEDDVRQSSRALVAFSAGIPAFMLIKVLVSGYYARQEMKLPVKIAVCALIANILLCLAFMKPFAHVGLALATTLSGYFNAGLLLYFLCQRGYYRPNKSCWLTYFLQLLVANGGMLFGLWLMTYFSQSLLLQTLGKRLSYLFVVIVLSALCYLVLLRMAGLRLGDFKRLSEEVTGCD